MAETIKLPAALAHGLVPAGLTAPALRMALMLIAAAGARTGRIDILKPHLERGAAVRLDNAHRSLERLRECTIVDAGGQPAHLFDELVYTPGEQKRLAGIITGSLSGTARAAIGQPQFAGRTIEISLDELRRLSTIPGILLLARLAADRPNGDIRLRMGEDECQRTFGDYLSRATIERQNADGQAFRWTALSRIFAELIEPGVKDLWSALDGHVVDAVPGVPENRGHGNAWSHIDITLKRLAPRKTLRELAAVVKADEEYQVRKRRPRGSADTPR
jgi:hypothetical protein